MHDSVMKFGRDHLTSEMVTGKTVLEVGSLNVNGSIRTHVEGLKPASYLGIDLQSGPGVDVIVDFCALTSEQAMSMFGQFDLIVSTEMLEHAEYWRSAITNMKALLKPGGRILLTTRSFGFPRHGYPYDYWRFNNRHMIAIFSDYTGVTIQADPQVPGVFVLAQKPVTQVASVDLSTIEVDSVDQRATNIMPVQVGPVKIAAMLRVKNEGRWIERVLKSIEPLCNYIAVLDDHSTDNTFAIAQSRGLDSGNEYLLIRSEFEGLNETRDKNYLLKRIMDWCNPDWVLHIDGDEELEPAGVEAIRAAVMSQKAKAYALQVLYLWNDEHTIRTDGIFGKFVRQSLFNTRVTNGLFNPTAHGQGTAANLHCTNVPEDLRYETVISTARLLHYGYIDRSMRLAKWDFYNTVDPDNVLEDRYRHAVAGDIPEVPAWVKTKWAGPLTLEPFVPQSTSGVANA